MHYLYILIRGLGIVLNLFSYCSIFSLIVAFFPPTFTFTFLSFFFFNSNSLSFYTKNSISCLNFFFYGFSIFILYFCHKIMHYNIFYYLPALHGIPKLYSASFTNITALFNMPQFDPIRPSVLVSISPRFNTLSKCNCVSRPYTTIS